MPTLPVRTQQPSPVSPQVELPPEFPDIPQEVLDRFPSAKDWQSKLDEFWTRTKQSINQAQTQAANYANSRVTYSVDTFRIYAKNGIPQPMFAVDSTGVKLGDTLVISTVGRKVFIGEGVYADAQTPFYIDTLGRFSLGASLTWNPDTSTLAITGIITATSGTIGGFDIGADYIRDAANTFGMASTVTVGDDVRFWAGATFANRDTAPVRIRESGDTTITRLLAQSISMTGDFVSSSPSALYIGTNVYSSGGRANGIEILGNYVAEANNVVLRGIYVVPSLAKNSWTGLSAVGLSVILNNASGAGTIANAYGVYIDTVNVGTNNYAIYTTATAGSSAFLGGINSTNIGATTPGTGAFTTLSATVGVSLTNASNPLIFAQDTTATTGPTVFMQAAHTIGSGEGLFGTTGNHPVGIYVNATKVATISSTGLAVTGVISTTDPVGGAGPNWKLGQYTAGVAVQAGKVRVEIAGTPYDLLTA